MSEYIGLAWVKTDDDIFGRLCEFPPFKPAVAKDAKVVIDGLRGQEIAEVLDFCTVAKKSAEYRMIVHGTGIYAQIFGTVDEFKEAEGGE